MVLLGMLIRTSHHHLNTCRHLAMSTSFFDVNHTSVSFARAVHSNSGSMPCVGVIVFVGGLLYIPCTMNPEHFALAADIINSPSYIAQAQQSHNQRDKLWRDLLSQRRIPQKPWSEQDIEWVLGEVAKMDSNNFEGVEGFATWASASARRGLPARSSRGDITGATKQAAAACLLLPMATGMSLVLALRALKERRGPEAKYVIWPRMDQRSCFKAILTAGLVPLVIPNLIDGDQVCTDLTAVERAIAEHGADSIVSIFTTTSCFAPRVPDSLVPISKLCATHGLPHLVNNAYGLASPRCMNAVSEACKRGRVDLYVQSTDKNFLVPVGGAVVAGPDKGLVEEVGRMYP
ncbi:soluble liver antigen/liver pancreas antigen, isoform CRA_d, partial [Jimgerdemannia flammicorona]